MRNISFIVTMLLAALVCNVAVAKSDKTDPISKWAGSYESVSGRCGVLQVQETKITWGSCKEAAAKLISVSTSELVMEIDPSAADCGWAGLIVALEKDAGGEPRKAAPKITISAYTNMEDYKNTNRFVQCSYFKKD